MDLSLYNRAALIRDNPRVFATALDCRGKSSLRNRLTKLFSELEVEAGRDEALSITARARIRDCGQVLANMLQKRSDELAGFSLAQALLDLARGVPRADLSPAFFADLYHILQGMQGLGSSVALEDVYVTPSISSPGGRRPSPVPGSWIACGERWTAASPSILRGWRRSRLPGEGAGRRRFAGSWEPPRRNGGTGAGRSLTWSRTRTCWRGWSG